jgi:hypothetical protein
VRAVGAGGEPKRTRGVRDIQPPPRAGIRHRSTGNPNYLGSHTRNKEKGDFWRRATGEKARAVERVTRPGPRLIGQLGHGLPGQPLQWVVRMIPPATPIPILTSLKTVRLKALEVAVKIRVAIGAVVVFLVIVVVVVVVVVVVHHGGGRDAGIREAGGKFCRISGVDGAPSMIVRCPLAPVNDTTSFRPARKRAVSLAPDEISRRGNLNLNLNQTRPDQTSEIFVLADSPTRRADQTLRDSQRSQQEAVTVRNPVRGYQRML